MTPAWTFDSAVSTLPCAEFQDRTLSVGPLYPQAVWSNQRRAALIAWPWQEARWSWMGHHLPGERSFLTFSSPILSFSSPSAKTSPSSEGMLESHPSHTPDLQAATRGTSNRNVTLFERIPGLRTGPARFSWTCRQGSHFYYTKPVSVPWHKRLRGCCSGKGRSLSDLWLIHSSSSCQANITLSEWSMWHSITPSGCDRTSPFPLPSLRAISDIASLLLHPAVYFSCLHSWIPYIWVSLSGSVIRLNLSLSITLSFVLKTLELAAELISFWRTAPYLCYVFSVKRIYQQEILQWGNKLYFNFKWINKLA